MKKLLLISLVMIFGITVFAQGQKRLEQKSLQTLSMPASVAIDNQLFAPINPGNTVVNSKAALDEVIGATRYDMQTNGSCQNRFYVNEDGTMTGTWTRGLLDAGGYTDRGTGYNYYNGSTWAAMPTARIETVKTGWPSYAPLGATGELVISHRSAVLPLKMEKRAVIGTGAWTESDIPMPSGVLGLTWHRAITSGPDHNYIHMIALTGPVANGGSPYQGLDGALLYYRSLDGGVTWDKLGVILPDLSSADYVAFGGDDYAWASPKGDTIAFMVGGSWTDTFIMKSYDNGSSWTKVPILSNGNKKQIATTYTPPFKAADGSVAVEMDNNGVFHAIFGRMQAADDGTGHKYYPGFDGLIYWNSTMPMVKDSLDLDTLDAHGQLLGFVLANTAGDSIHLFPYYGVSLSSFPQISIDADNSIYVIWSGLTVGNPSPDDYNYRHLWSRSYNPANGLWSDFLDLNEGLFYIYKEYAYPSMAKNFTADNVHFIYQSADVPGSNIKDTTIPVHDNTIEYRTETKRVLNPTVGVAEKSAAKNEIGPVCPNPVSDFATINVKVAASANLSLSVCNITGQQMMNINKGSVAAGVQTFTINASQLTSGIYFVTVTIGNESITKKMIVK